MSRFVAVLSSSPRTRGSIGGFAERAGFRGRLTRLRPATDPPCEVVLAGDPEACTFECDDTFVLVDGDFYSSIPDTGAVPERARRPAAEAHRLWVEHGVRWPERANGVFSAVIFDKRSSRLLLFRDHMGIKPLYYRRVADGLELSSTLYPLLQSGPAPLRLLPPGSMLDGQDVTPYFELGRTPSRPSTAKLRHILETAVLQRAPLDQKLAICLSGGIDSSIIAAILTSAGRRPTAYTVETHQSLDGEYAGQLAASLGLLHRRIRITRGDIERVLPMVIRCVETYDKVVVENAVVSYFAYKRAAEDDSEAVFCGQGADDIFGSYPFFRRLSSRELQREQRFYLRNTHRFDVQRVERLSSAFGLAVRLPFLAPEVVTYCVNLPVLNKRRTVAGRFIDKPLLRRSAYDLPREVRYKGKEVMCESSGVDAILSEVAADASFVATESGSNHSAVGDWPITSREANYYFQIWKKLFPEIYQAGFGQFERLGEESPFHIGFE